VTPSITPSTSETNEDPFAANVISLLHFDGADGSTTFTDETGKVWTAAGNAQIDTAQSKFGGASGLFDGADSYISTPDSDDWDFGTGDFTVECWVRFASIASTQTLVANYVDPATGWGFQLRRDVAELRFGYGDTPLISPAWTPSVGVFYHVAVARSGTSLRVFVDGVQLGSTVTNSTNIAGSPARLYVGGLMLSSPPRLVQALDGWLDDLRITKGVARYTATFTPPSAPFPNP
jgi:hypothetical protein